ncbi:IclR family transcriptional regulator [Pseudonocardia adelaidensis]|uniref:IclR family transcriptional regulator n=1 Tax=Pseudonocardia adelaidensis TaxID=648754 RepID=UPI0031F0C3DA
MSELLRRAVQVLEVLRVSDDALSIRQVADRAGLSKSTVQRLLRELVDTDLAGQDPVTQRYRLGPRTLALGVAYQRRLNLRQAALPHMGRLRDAAGETVGLTVAFGGDQMMHIEQLESVSELRATFDIGRPLPLWSGAPSRLFLAARPDEDIRRILDQHDPSEITPINPPEPAALFADVQNVRAQGYAVAVEETLPGVSTLSAPIRAAGADLVATLSLTSPSSRLTEDAIRSLLPELLRTARAISADLGHLPPGSGGW